MVIPALLKIVASKSAPSEARALPLAYLALVWLCGVGGGVVARCLVAGTFLSWMILRYNEI